MLSLFFHSSDGPAQDCVNLSRWFVHHLIWSSAQSHHIFTTLYACLCT